MVTAEGNDGRVPSDGSSETLDQKLSPPDSLAHRMKEFTIAYLRKFKGTAHKLHPFPKRPTIRVLVSTFVASFCGIIVVAAINDKAPHFADGDYVMFIASFGASSALVHGAIDSPLAQPRNAIGGSVLSAFVGVCLAKAFRSCPEYNFIAVALAVAISLNVMQLTRTFHPPGGATSAIAIVGSAKIQNLGFLYLIFPVLIGECLLVFIALLINNCAREYPLYWYRPKKRLLTNAPQDTLVPSVGAIERHIAASQFAREHDAATTAGHSERTSEQPHDGIGSGSVVGRVENANDFEIEMADVEREASADEKSWIE